MASSRHPTWPLPLEAGRQTSAWANVLDDSHLPRVLTHVEALKSEVTESPIQEVVSPVEKAVNRDAEAISIWRANVAGLNDVQLKEFLSHSRENLEEYAQGLQVVVEEQQEDSVAGKIAGWIEPLFKTLNIIAPIATNLSPLDPRFSSLILGGITSVLSLSSKYLDFQEKLANMLSEMIEKLNVLIEYESNYPKDSRVGKALVGVYGVILEFCVKGSKLFVDDKGKKKLGGRVAVKSSWSSFEGEFGKLKTQFQTRLEVFQMAKSGQLEKDLRLLGRDQRAFMKDIRQYLASDGRRAHSEEQSRKELDRMRELKEAASRVDSRRREKEEQQKRLSWQDFNTLQGQKVQSSVALTGKWLLEHNDFKKWRDNADSDLFWIHGKSGSGKSHVAASVIQHLRDTEVKTFEMRPAKESTGLAFVYCSKLVETDTNPTRLLGSVLEQLFRQLPLFERLPPLEDALKNSNGPPSILDIKPALNAILPKFSRVFVVVDGLDECYKPDEDDFPDFCKFLASLRHLPNASVKTIVFSRPKYADIEDAFVGCRELQVDNGQNADDINRYIDAKTEGLTENLDVLKEIKTSLLEKADGMFLWVDLVIKAVRPKGSAGEKKKAVGDLPRQLNDIYEKTLKRVLESPDESTRDRAIKAILWVTNSERELKRSELREILAIEPGQTDWDDINKFEHDERLPEECADLIALVDGRYRLIHASLKDYLTEKAIKSQAVRGYGSKQDDHSRIMAETCLTFLNFEIFKAGPARTAEDLAELLGKHPFLKYASLFWGFHLQGAHDRELFSLAKKFLEHHATRELVMQTTVETLRLGNGTWPYPGSTTPFHLMCTFDLVELAETFTATPAQINRADGFDLFPLDYAIMGPEKRMTSWLLQKHTQLLEKDSTYVVAQSSRPRVALASRRNWAEIIIQLVKLGHDKNERAGDSRVTPLHTAAQHGAEEALDALLSIGAHCNITNTDGETPIHLAAEESQLGSVLKLIEAGADVKVASDERRTALYYAVSTGKIKIVEALLERGADINAVTKSGSTPLYAAVLSNNVEMARFLIQRGAAVHGGGPRGWNALLLAADSGFLGLVELLLDSEAKLDVYRPSHRGPLHVAANSGHLDVVKTLCDRGATVDALSVEKHTPLYEAILAEHLEISIVLMQTYHADPLVLGESHTNALHCAAVVGLAELIPVLISEKGIPPDSRCSDGSTPLHLAARASRTDFVHQLVAAVPALDLTPKNDFNETPLHCAARAGAVDLVKFFLEQTERDWLEVGDVDMNRPIHLAASRGYVECVKLLISPTNINSLGCRSETALFKAASNGHLAVVEFLLQDSIHGDVDLNIGDEFQQTPLFIAVANEHMIIANLLLDKGADPKLENNVGFTPLHFVAYAGEPCLDLCARLLDLGCDPLLQPQFGTGVSPFIYAVDKKRPEVIDLFLKRGFDGTSIPDRQKTTCLHYAARTGSIELFNTIIGNVVDQLAAVLATDCLGRDVLHFAAGAGELEMVKAFLISGFPPDGLKKGFYSPVHEASRSGFFSIVELITTIGGDVRKRSTLPEARTPLHSSGRYLRSTERLLEAGADPHVPNSVGLTPPDLAAIHIRQRLCSMGYPYHSKRQPERIAQACQVAMIKHIELIKALPDLSNDPDPLLEYYRLIYVSDVGEVLAMIGTEDSIEDAKMCLAEITSPSEVRAYDVHLMCDICHTDKIRGAWYACLKCLPLGSTICGRCYNDQFSSDGENRKKFHAVLCELERLETILMPVRLIGRAVLTSRMTTDFFFRCCCLLYTTLPMREWILTLMRKYETWNEEADEFDGRFYKRVPGGRFLKLISRVWEIVERTDGGAHSSKGATSKEEGSDENDKTTSRADDLDTFEAIARDFEKLYHDHKADRELDYFTCYGHNFTEIPTISSIPEEKKAIFDANGRLKPEFFQGLVEKYGEAQPTETTAGERNTQSHQVVHQKDTPRTQDKEHLPADAAVELPPERSEPAPPPSTMEHPLNEPSQLKDRATQGAELLEEPSHPKDQVTEGTEILNETSHSADRTARKNQKEKSAHSFRVEAPVDERSDRGEAPNVDAFTVKDNFGEELSTPRHLTIQDDDSFTPHWMESEVSYRNRLVTNYEPFVATRRELSKMLDEVYRDLPDLKAILDEGYVSEEDIQDIDISLIPDSKIMYALTLELGWQMTQVALFGFVSRTMTQYLRIRPEKAGWKSNNNGGEEESTKEEGTEQQVRNGEQVTPSAAGGQSLKDLSHAIDQTARENQQEQTVSANAQNTQSAQGVPGSEDSGDATAASPLLPGQEFLESLPDAIRGELEHFLKEARAFKIEIRNMRIQSIPQATGDEQPDDNSTPNEAETKSNTETKTEEMTDDNTKEKTNDNIGVKYEQNNRDRVYKKTEDKTEDNINDTAAQSDKSNAVDDTKNGSGEPAEDTSKPEIPAIKLRKFLSSITQRAPFRVYNFYDNPVLPILLSLAHDRGDLGHDRGERKGGEDGRNINANAEERGEGRGEGDKNDVPDADDDRAARYQGLTTAEEATGVALETTTKWQPLAEALAEAKMEQVLYT